MVAERLNDRACDLSLRHGKQQLVAVRIVDLSRIVAPPGSPRGYGTLLQLAPQVPESIRGQLDEEARFVPTRGVLAEDDLAIAPAYLANCARAVALMPVLLEAELVN